MRRPWWIVLNDTLQQSRPQPPRVAPEYTPPAPLPKPEPEVVRVAVRLDPDDVNDQQTMKQIACLMAQVAPHCVIDRTPFGHVAGTGPTFPADPDAIATSREAKHPAHTTVEDAA